jgi:hypothetical protein
MKITIQTDDLLDLLYALGVRLDTLTAKDIIMLDETTPFSKKFLLQAADEEPAHVRTQNSIAQIEQETGRAIHDISVQQWKGLTQ